MSSIERHVRSFAINDGCAFADAIKQHAHAIVAIGIQTACSYLLMSPPRHALEIQSSRCASRPAISFWLKRSHGGQRLAKHALRFSANVESGHLAAAHVLLRGAGDPVEIAPGFLD